MKRAPERAIEIGETIAGYPALQTRLTREMLRENAGEYDFNVLLKREVDAFVTMFKANRRPKAEGTPAA